MDKVYFIKGSKENPEGVRQALLDVCPNAENIARFTFDLEGRYYYVINGRIDYAEDDSYVDLLKVVGTELEAKKIERFVEKTMYQRLFKHQEDIYEAGKYYATIEDAMSGDEAIGYKEVKITIKE